MSNPRQRKVWSDVWAYPGRTFLVMSSIALGVIAIGMILGSSTILAQAMTQSFRAINPASVIVFTEPLDQFAIDSIQNVPNVATVEGRTSINLRAEVAPGQWRTLTLYSMPSFETHTVSKIIPESGAWPPGDSGIVLERGSVEYLNTATGQNLTVELPQGGTTQINVNGIAHDLYRLPGAFNGGGVGFVAPEMLASFGADTRFTELHVIAADNRDDPDTARALGQAVRTTLENQGRRVDSLLVSTPDQHPLGSIVQAIILVLSVIGLLALLLSGFLVTNTIQALLKNQTRQIGIMKSIGATHNAILAMYLQVVMWFCLFALLIGVPISYLSMQWFSRLIARNLNFDITSVSIPLSSLIIAAVIGLFVPLFASIWPIRAASKKTVREAITDYGVDTEDFGTGFLDRMLQQLKGFSRPTLLGIRNTFRSKKRLLLTFITLILASAISVSVFTVQSSLGATLDHTMAYFGDDVSVELNSPSSNDAILGALQNIKGIETIELWGQAPATWERPDNTQSDSIVLWAPPADTQTLNPTVLEGRWLEETDSQGIVVNTYLFDDQHPINIGDELILQVKGLNIPWQVVGIIEGVPNGIPPAPYVYTTYAAYTQAVNESGLSRRIQVITANKDEQSRSQVASAISTNLKQAGLPFKTAITANDLQTAFESVFNIVIILLLVMAVLLAVVGGLGLMGTMSLNVLDRTREIGIMRSIGATRGSIQRIVLVEGLTIGVLSWLLGVIVAIPLSQLLSSIVGTAFMATPLIYVFSIIGTLVWLVIIVIISTIASLIPAVRAARLPVREVLAYE